MKKQPEKKQREAGRAFTMIELLVVIAIIAILAGLLLPAVITGMKQSEVAQARTEVKLIAAAMNAYRTDYGKWPGEISNRDTSTTIYWDYLDLINTLRGTNVTGSVIDQMGITAQGATTWKNQNPKQRVYLQVSDKSIATNANGTTGNYTGTTASPTPSQPYAAQTGELADPWGNRYCVLPDWDGDGEIKGADGEPSIRASIAVWSWGPNPQIGPNGTLENPTNNAHIRSWK